jgi:hypothetical protein
MNKKCLYGIQYSIVRLDSIPYELPQRSLGKLRPYARAGLYPHSATTIYFAFLSGAGKVYTACRVYNFPSPDSALAKKNRRP